MCCHLETLPEELAGAGDWGVAGEAWGVGEKPGCMGLCRRL